MTDEYVSDARRKVRFDPTINLGHLVSAGVFLISSGIAYATVMTRLDVADREIVRVERQARDAVERAERRFDVDQQRDREAFNEIKSLLREINTKIDLKMDKPR